MRSPKPLTRNYLLSLTVGVTTLGVTLGLIPGTTPAASAQSTAAPAAAPAATTPTVWNETQQDPFSTRGEGFSTGSITDLIRRAGQTGIDWDTFRQNQDRNLNDAASSFRTLQQKRLGQPALPQTQTQLQIPSQGQPIAPGTNAPSSAPLTR